MAHRRLTQTNDVPCPTKAFSLSNGDEDTKLTQRIIHLLNSYIDAINQFYFSNGKKQNTCIDFQEFL
ncbi:hypothetical protein CKO_00386 [Citrobacter koseri ATCC BAA-895]|uniref:Uncharacterized protein n=1 Tax=Citrobacter koseri (strain ATCC BAA-895 / CDC 4225-83 / SGSC4696) TaxID=290338 RepID=A8ADI5_CITK8|nr:hypothetical protein CKO_00386 [Citrobacter koseri ATCC BAA-895]